MNEIAIISGKGGTGKTSLSAAFATIQYNSIVADCDVDAANLYLILQPQNIEEHEYVSGYTAHINYENCTNCGLCITHCKFDAISLQNSIVTISEVACDGCKLCSRICPASAITMEANNKSRWYIGTYKFGTIVHARLAPGEENTGKLVTLVREQAQLIAKQSKCKTIIIDGPPGIGCAPISSIIGVDSVIIVTEPTKSGFHDMKRTFELTQKFKLKSYIVINKYDLNSDLSNNIEKWCNENSVELVGKLPFNKLIVEAMLNCKSIIEFAPNSKISQEIIRIWDTIFYNK